MLRFAAYHEFDGDYGEPVQKSTANRYESTNSRFAGVRSEFSKLVPVEKKNKKRKRKKTKESEGVAAANQNATTLEIQNLSISEKKLKEQTEAKPSQMRTVPSGLLIEELSVGKPDGKSAASGKKVSVAYTGKLEKGGEIFASTDRRMPFEFRLGVGQVIDGWEVGINGMRIGEKRRITIPPSMGYGDKHVGNIPRNSSLVFDVELVDVSH